MFIPGSGAFNACGCPIRTPPHQSPLAAPRRFSQLAASFIGGSRLGIHRMPFSRFQNQYDNSFLNDAFRCTLKQRFNHFLLDQFCLHLFPRRPKRTAQDTQIVFKTFDLFSCQCATPEKRTADPKTPGTNTERAFLKPPPSREQGSAPAALAAPGHVLFRKEVIQPHLPIRLPCYDFVPIISHTLGASAPEGSGQQLRVQLTFMT